MDIKEKIGQRISETRRAAKLTLKELAQKTGELKPTRIGNWEHGKRTPGPYESHLLAKALGVSPAYLLCLTDTPDSKNDLSNVLINQVPVLTFADISKSMPNPKERPQQQKTIPINDSLKSKISTSSYALIINDDSMAPEFSKNDIIIVDPDLEPNPGDFVIAKIEEDDKFIFRKLRELKDGYELVPINTNWAPIKVSDAQWIVATVIEHRRQLVDFHD